MTKVLNGSDKSYRRCNEDCFKACLTRRNNNTHLCVNLKTRLVTDVMMKRGKRYVGWLTRDKANRDYVFDDEHFTFTEIEDITRVKHNPKVFEGRYISLTLRDDGTLRPNFKMLATLASDFSLEKYTRGVYEELHMALRMNMNVRP